ncbi:MAG: hypothetical protein NT173_06085, partial [Opitutales bacterium]|nr:hypothetical protein [Opitutales bacterium]
TEFVELFAQLAQGLFERQDVNGRLHGRRFTGGARTVSTGVSATRLQLQLLWDYCGIAAGRALGRMALKFF